MNNFYNNLYYYLEYVIIPYLLTYEIVYLNKNNIDISFLKLAKNIKKVINIDSINYSKLRYITYNLLLTKYNYKIINYSPIKLSYEVNK